MEKLELRARVSNGNQVLKEWREFHSSNLPALINSVAHLKEFLNEFSVNVQNQRGSVTTAEGDGSVIYNENFEDDEEKEDPLLGTIQELMNHKEPSKLNKKEKEENRYYQKAKKMKI